MSEALTTSVEGAPRSGAVRLALSDVPAEAIVAMGAWLNAHYPQAGLDDDDIAAMFREGYNASLPALVALIEELRGRAAKSHAETRAFWDALVPKGPRCRDCADFDGRCQGDGPPCAPQEHALENLTKLKAERDRLLLEQAKQIREATAEIQQLRQRIEEEFAPPFVIVSSGLNQAEIDAFTVRPCPIEIVDTARPPAIERLGPIVPVRAIKGMSAAGNSPAEIARDLGLDVAIVRQVLG